MQKIFASTDNTREIINGERKLIRSDVPTRLSEGEREWLLANSVHLVIDLRTDREREAKPCPLEFDNRFDYRKIPLTGGDTVPTSVKDVPKSYIKMADKKLDLARDLILNSGGALFFCNAGKDRTGVLAAALLCKLGFPDEYIVSDYMTSRDNLIVRLLAFARANPEIDIEVITPREDYIREFLAWYRENR